jgi:phosphotriesterase-related protein
MKVVQSARGELGSSELGRTLMHEHVFVLTPEVQQNYPETWGEDEDRITSAVERLNRLKDAGIDTIVDLTVIGLGRYVPRIERVAARTPINIVVATGLYTYERLPHFFAAQGPGTMIGGHELMVDMFVRDIVEGIPGTAVKAGILKCATDLPGLTPDVERVLRAVAKAHRETGVPISTHTDSGTRRGLDQQRIFTEEGVDLARVVIGHSGDTTDIEYLEALLMAGSYLGMDRFGLDLLLPFEDRVRTVATLCERGWAERIVLSHDATCYGDNFHNVDLSTFAPNWEFTHISRDVLPALLNLGVTPDQIDQMLIHNPRRILEPGDAY